MTPVPRIIEPELKQLVASNTAIIRRLERIEGLLLLVSQRQVALEIVSGTASQEASKTEAPRAVGPVVRGIAERVALETGVSFEDIMGRGKTMAVCAARFRVYAEAADAGVPYAAIGRAMGRDHSSVIAGAARHRARGGQNG